MGIDTQEYCLGNLQINGEDIGIVTVVEVITENYVHEKYGSNNGNLYKPEMNFSIIDYNGADLRYVDDEVSSYNSIFENTKTVDTNEEDKKRLVSIIKDIEFAQSTQDIEECFIDFKNVIKMVAINKAVSNVDCFTGRTIRNFYLYEENGKIDIIPFDFNISLGMQPEDYLWSKEEVYSLELDEEQYGMYSKIIDIILEYDEYKILYEQYIDETLNILNNMEKSGYVDEVNDRVTCIIEKSVNKNFTIEEHEIGIRDLKEYLKNRKK